MRPDRRKFLLAGAVVAAAALPRLAAAEDYPSRPVRIVAGFAAGGEVDVTARLIGQWLAGRLGQQFIIENRPGAGGNIGTEAVVRAQADGYTILMIGPAAAINVTLYYGLSSNLRPDLPPVAGIMRTANVLEVNPSLPFKTVPELIAYAKA